MINLQEETLKRGTIFHIIILEGVEEAFKLYPEEQDFILDTMNTDFYKNIKNGYNWEEKRSINYMGRNITEK